jgi:hypothetical protein
VQSRSADDLYRASLSLDLGLSSYQPPASRREDDDAFAVCHPELELVQRHCGGRVFALCGSNDLGRDSLAAQCSNRPGDLSGT